MGWFDEQIRLRAKKDQEAFSGAFSGMADVVMNKQLAALLRDQSQQSRQAVGEILKFYGLPFLQASHERTVSRQLEEELGSRGFLWRKVKSEGKWHRNAWGAMLGRRAGLDEESGKVIALIPRPLGGYDFFDPDTGRREKITRRTCSLLAEEALCFYKPLPQREIGLKDLAAYAIDSVGIGDWLLFVLATLAVSLVGLLPPWLHDVLYTEASLYGSLRALMSTGVFLLCAGFAGVLLGTYKYLTLGRISGKAGAAMQAAGMARLLALRPSFFQSHSAGELQSRLERMGELCSSTLNTVLSGGLTALFYLGQMAGFAPGLVIPGLLVLLATGAASLLGMAVRLKLARKAMERQSRESGLAYGLMMGIQKLKLAGAEKRAFSKWAGAYIPVAKVRYDPPLTLRLAQAVCQWLPLAGTAALWFFAVKTQVAVGDYFAFIASYGVVSGAFSTLMDSVESFVQIKPLMSLLTPVLTTVPEFDPGKKRVEKLSGSIEMSHVSFQYGEKAPWVLNDLSLKIRPGEYVALVGGGGRGREIHPDVAAAGL